MSIKVIRNLIIVTLMVLLIGVLYMLDVNLLWVSATTLAGFGLFGLLSRVE